MSPTAINVADGRRVGIAEFGARDGIPVIWCHGGSGCRLEPAFLQPAAADAGLRLIGIDRPGYGLSTPLPGRTIGSWVGDAWAVADKLGIDTFATIGISTGGAFALALAASSPRVKGAIACCALTDTRWPEGRAMMLLENQIWSAPDRNAARAVVASQVGERGEKVPAFMKLMPLAASDQRLLANPRWVLYWQSCLREWYAQGVIGYTDDRLADGAGWISFDAARITCPVVLLHGTADTFAPVAHAKHTLGIIPHARLELREGLGHFSIFTEIVPELRRLLGI